MFSGWKICLIKQLGLTNADTVTSIQALVINEDYVYKLKLLQLVD